MQQALGDTADDKPAERSASMGAHDDQVSVQGLSDLGESLRDTAGGALDDMHRHLDAGLVSDRVGLRLDRVADLGLVEEHVLAGQPAGEKPFAHVDDVQLAALAVGELGRVAQRAVGVRGPSVAQRIMVNMVILSSRLCG